MQHSILFVLFSMLVSELVVVPVELLYDQTFFHPWVTINTLFFASSILNFIELTSTVLKL